MLHVDGGNADERPAPVLGLGLTTLIFKDGSHCLKHDNKEELEKLVTDHHELVIVLGDLILCDEAWNCTFLDNLFARPQRRDIESQGARERKLSAGTIASAFDLCRQFLTRGI